MTHQPLILLSGTRVEDLWVLKSQLVPLGFLAQAPVGIDDFGLALGYVRPDLALVDMSGDEMRWLEAIRKQQSASPVPLIALLPRGSQVSVARCLDEGADDCQQKPIGAEVLAARIRTVLRRTPLQIGRSEVLQVEDLEIDTRRGTARQAGSQVSLSKKECQVLRQLAARAGAIVNREELASRVWGSESRERFQLLRVVISRLRQKLEKNAGPGELIETYPGVGYRLRKPPDEGSTTFTNKSIIKAA
jgi:two-component system KDP operon response regulator KdpE